MTNMDTAPSQPVNDEQDTTAANDAITITAEGPFGSVSWTPGEHQQEHLRELADQGKLDGYREFASEELSQSATAAAMTLCVRKSVLGMLADLFDSDEEEMAVRVDVVPLDLDDKTFEDIITGNFPRS